MKRLSWTQRRRRRMFWQATATYAAIAAATFAALYAQYLYVVKFGY